MGGKGLNVPEAIGALCVILIGALVIWEGSSYDIGTATRMGPGYFPVVLGGIVVLFGVALFYNARTSLLDAPRIPYRAIIAISAGVIAFGALVERIGMIPAVISLVLLSSLAEERPRPVTIAVLAAGLSLFAYLVFILGFRLPVRPLQWG